MITIEGNSTALTLRIEGKFSSMSVFGVNAEIQTMLREYGIPEHITLDVSKVIYMNASVLLSLYYLARFMRNKGKQCSIQGKRGIVDDFIRLAGMEFVCIILDDA